MVGVRAVPASRHRVLRSRALSRIRRVMDYGFVALYGLLGIRLVVVLMRARPQGGFMLWVWGMTDPLLAPFRGILPAVRGEGRLSVALSVGLTIVVYGTIHFAIRWLLRLIAHRRAQRVVP